MMNIWGSNCVSKYHNLSYYHIVSKPKNNLNLSALTPKYPCSTSPLSVHALSICPLLGPQGAFWYAPSLLARLYFFIRPSGGCQSPRGCQSTLILIRTWVLSGVNGSQQLSTGLSQSYRNSYITQCMHTHMHTRVHTHTRITDYAKCAKWKARHTCKYAVERIITHTGRFTLKSLVYEHISI